MIMTNTAEPIETIVPVPNSSTPSSLLRTLFCAPAAAFVRRKILAVLTLLFLINLAVWLGAIVALRDFPELLGVAALAYTLGLRHAVDADHLSAIDNVTRKLLQSNVSSEPVTVGLFFSLGHSSIVVAASIAIAATAATIQSRFGDFQAVGTIIGSSVSAAFLLLIAVMNAVVLVGVIRTLRKLKREGVYQKIDIEELLAQSGLLGRFFRPVFRFIDAPWKMYPLGLLFGLGFDTSTEVALLGISATQSARGMSIWLIFLFPALFTAGMSLVDTADGILMLVAYRWAFVNPVRKLYYNLLITAMSVTVAILVALIEVLNTFQAKFDLQGSFWDFFANLGDQLGTIGYVIIGVFFTTWAISAVVYRWKRE
ncbi:hydrogenase nickel incorporation protein hupN [Jimgerdemannia flammicorona]|uniref:Nickel/cobalt efflux system n=1 Tax=Jimgerdemannia flammicorona TaxID=994334 RepID=A0A433QIZ5_9FUNG|nr:hydrogenase nickel incorporation protein hupN [Jimgerdemannia flammicorona]